MTTHAVGAWYEADPATGVGTAYYPFNGVPVAMQQGGTLSYLHHDHLGSLVSATDASGAELGWARYYPFGGLRLSGGTLPSDRLFTGQTRDFGDSFYFFKARYYDAGLGQFYSPDTVVPNFSKGGPQDPQALNRYAYALNNPLRLADPSGRAAIPFDTAPPPLDPSTLNNSLSTFASASWDQRIAWLQSFQTRNLLGGWFNNVLGILRYFRGSPTFQHSAQALEGDARVLWVIQEGFAASRGLTSTSTNDPAALTAIADWRQFFQAYNAPNTSIAGLKQRWGAAEQAGVNYADRFPAPFASTYEAGLYEAFVWIGDRYRTAVLHNLPLPGDRYPDPRNDAGYVYQSAQDLEAAYAAGDYGITQSFIPPLGPASDGWPFP